MSPLLPQTWNRLLDSPFEKAEFARTLARAEAAARQTVVFPPREDWFSAFWLTPPRQVRAVILGQDPYHAPGQAHGLAFSVREGTKLPPSLRNIYQEMSADLGVPAPASGDLTPWARQGVLLLNTVLTVEQGRANSHENLGWQAFTDAVIARLAVLPQPVAFVLWGAQAQKKAPLAERSNYPRLILHSAHPSPLSAYRGFFGSRPFSQINAFLAANGQTPICWQMEDRP